MVLCRIYNFHDMEQFVDVENIMHIIEAKDPSFHISKVDEEKMEIFLEHENKDILHKKASWCIHKLDLVHRCLVYDIIEGEKNA